MLQCNKPELGGRSHHVWEHLAPSRRTKSSPALHVFSQLMYILHLLHPPSCPSWVGECSIALPGRCWRGLLHVSTAGPSLAPATSGLWLWGLTRRSSGALLPSVADPDPKQPGLVVTLALGPELMFTVTC